MKTISLKVPDDVYERIETNRKRENMNRSSYVMEAVVAYSKTIEREKLGEQLRKESIQTAEEYETFKSELEDFEGALMDGLTDEN
ncbi:MAG: metal-responsive CopG/Arc/MetJ family transcriptional regulator [Marinoscillum sp.]|jgi:metal-responsive CopG/Arc/MetJ family transcriptional regulator